MAETSRTRRNSEQPDDVQGVLDPRSCTQDEVFDDAHPPRHVPVTVSASPWTTSIKDDAFVSNLVSLWFTWGDPMFTCIDQNLFIRDMKLGKTKCGFCSRFLVNALLAAACSLSKHDVVSAQDDTASSLTLRLIGEAKCMLAQEEHHDITTAQGLGMLFYAMASTGQESSGFEYLQRAASVCRNLEIKYTVFDDASTQERHDMSRALNSTCWGLFNFSTMVHLSYQRLPDMLQPLRPMPPLVDVQPADHCVRYPASHISREGHCAEIAHQYSLLSVIARDASQSLTVGNACLLNGRSRLSRSLTQHHDQLLQWHRCLPEHLSATKNSPPGVLMLQFVTPFGKTLRSRLISSREYYSMLLIKVLKSLSVFQRVHESELGLLVTMARDAAYEIVRISHLWQSAYGSSNIFFLQHLALACAFFSDCGGGSNYDAELLDLCILFQELSCPSLAFAAFRMLDMIMRQHSKKFPAAVKELLQGVKA